MTSPPRSTREEYLFSIGGQRAREFDPCIYRTCAGVLIWQEAHERPGDVWLQCDDCGAIAHRIEHVNPAPPAERESEER